MDALFRRRGEEGIRVCESKRGNTVISCGIVRGGAQLMCGDSEGWAQLVWRQ